MTSDPDDAELIARSLGGDEDAFVKVVRRHEAAVGACPALHAVLAAPAGTVCGWIRTHAPG
jgi:hypothetical protein